MSLHFLSPIYRAWITGWEATQKMPARTLNVLFVWSGVETESWCYWCYFSSMMLNTCARLCWLSSQQDLASSGSQVTGHIHGRFSTLDWLRGEEPSNYWTELKGKSKRSIISHQFLLSEYECNVTSCLLFLPPKLPCQDRLSSKSSYTLPSLSCVSLQQWNM